jgi:hypothetical protein
MISLILALALPGQFRQCQTAATYQQSVTYAAPVQYQAYAAPYVEKVAFVAVEDPYYANLVGSQVRAQLKAKENLEAGADLAQRVGQLADAVGRLEAKIGAGAATVPVPTTPDQAPPTQPPPPGPGASVPSPVPPPPVPAGQPNAAVLAVLKTNCLKCHTDPAKAGGGFVMFDTAGALANLSPLDKVLIDQSVYSGDMPKGGKPLEADAYSAIRAWINEDADAIAAAVKACKNTKGSN